MFNFTIFVVLRKKSIFASCYSSCAVAAVGHRHAADTVGINV